MWGKTFQLSIFGESHGSAIGITISGLSAGLPFPKKQIDIDLKKRSPGKKNTTARKEKDSYEILSGVYGNHITGAPLTVIFRNTDLQSKDYWELQDKPRPSHADYPAHIKYHGFQDFRGGGHFSGRLTAPLVFAGAIAKAYLYQKGITISSELVEKKFLEQEIPKCMESGDSIGASVRCNITGVPTGIGNPFFDSLESHISHLAFSIPGIKGIEFGLGFHFIGKHASEVNDEYKMENNKIVTNTNHNGGILGGISTGMPISFRVVWKPTASIFQLQNTVSLSRKENTTLQLTGRHDPCIALRGQIVVEAVAAIAILDQIWTGAYYE